MLIFESRSAIKEHLLSKAQVIFIVFNISNIFVGILNICLVKFQVLISNISKLKVLRSEKREGGRQGLGRRQVFDPPILIYRTYLDGKPLAVHQNIKPDKIEE